MTAKALPFIASIPAWLEAWSVPRRPCAAAFAAVLILLLPGCASDPQRPPASRGSGTVVHSGHGHRAPYNKPYRVRGKTYVPMANAKGYRERGLASWYGWESGNRTAIGAVFDPRHFTAAHRTLPLPIRVRVTNLKNRRMVEVLVNDRGPFVKGRLIDLSQAAARALKINGTAPVEVSVAE